MEAIIQAKEGDKNKARVGAVIWLIALMIIIIIPWMTYQDPPPGQEGIVVNLGIPDVGQGNENAPIADASTPEESEPEEEETPEEEEKEPAKDPEPEKEEQEEKKQEPVKSDKKIIETDAEAIALKKKKDAEKKQQQKEQEEKRKAQKAKEAKEAEEAAKRKKAEAEKARKEAEAAAERAKKEAEANENKNAFADLLKGDGKADTGTSGNQGTKDGDPNSDNLTGISTGAGKVGGGLGNRGGVGPTITDNSQATGVVVIKVCVNEKGKVISATYTQKGSTTTNSTLKKLAEANAAGWSFDGGAAIDKQCGTITYDFKVK